MTPPSPPRPNLKEIRERAEAATAGPWAYRPQEFDDWGYVRTADADHTLVATARCGVHHEPFFDDHRRNGTDPFGPNAVFIAHARADIPLLLDYIDSLLSERDEAAAREREECAKLAEVFWKSSGTHIANAIRAMRGNAE